jgi:hypothetical protein
MESSIPTSDSSSSSDAPSSFTPKAQDFPPLVPLKPSAPATSLTTPEEAFQTVLRRRDGSNRRREGGITKGGRGGLNGRGEWRGTRGGTHERGGANQNSKNISNSSSTNANRFDNLSENSQQTDSHLDDFSAIQTDSNVVMLESVTADDEGMF